MEPPSAKLAYLNQKTADSKWKWLRARGSPLYGSTGEIIRWYGGCEDIDKLKELEEAMLLETLSAWQLSIPVFGTVAARTIPFVVLNRALRNSS